MLLDRAADVLCRPGVRRAIDAVTGTLVALGLRLAVASRLAS